VKLGGIVACSACGTIEQGLKKQCSGSQFLWLCTMSPLPYPSKLLEAQLLIAKSTGKMKRAKANKTGTTTIHPVSKTKGKDKENVPVPTLQEKAKHIAIA